MRPRKPKPETGEDDRDFVVALARGLEILRSFRKEGDSLGNKDFAERTGLSKSTVARLTYTLQTLGYLSFNASTSRYQLAPPVLSLGYSCLAGFDVRQERWGRARARYSLASNSRVRSIHARKLGWTPTRTSVHQWIARHLAQGSGH